MPTQQDAIAGTSSATKETSNLSSGGNQTQKSQEQLLAEYKAEAERKQGVIEDLKGTLETVQGEMTELRELVQSGEATRAQQSRLEQLNNQEGNLDFQISQIENDPKNKLGYLSIDRRIEKAAKQAEARGEYQALCKLQSGLIEDTADEVGINSDKLTKELIPIAKNYQFDVNGQPINVFRKAQLAIREWKKVDAQRKADAEAKKKEAEAGQSRESGTSEARVPGALDASKTKKLVPGTKEFSESLKALGL